MAISCDHRFDTPAGKMRGDDLAATAPRKGWQRLSAGIGGKGHRLYNWLLLDPTTAGGHQLLVRRSVSKPAELAYYSCRPTYPVPVTELVRVAGIRWGVEETFQFAKNETGLDHYQVGKYHAWYRHITPSSLILQRDQTTLVRPHPHRHRTPACAHRSLVTVTTTSPNSP
ncbi:hypothetical protein ACPZ19_48895 [Amycolatopsis lurida]